MKNNIYVTQPSLAPLNDFVDLLQDTWDTGILTHNGPLVRKLEADLCKTLNIEHLSVVTNGTVALQMAIKALELKGEIITTAFSWVATISAIKWEGCTPVFCDIDEDTFNIDIKKIEGLITDKTVAIMPVHVFGNPCDVNAIEIIAKKHGLKVIYDAAHAMGSKINGSSLLEFGDISATSFHGTKLFNTAEGGACITKSLDLSKKLERIRFFGHDDNKDIVEDGFNGKMTEIHAALGLANLKYYSDVLDDREVKYKKYKSELCQIEGIGFQKLSMGEINFSYFPIVLKSEVMLLKIESLLNENNIYPRRYFYPSLNHLSQIVDYQECPVSESLSTRILCLPLYKSLTDNELMRIVRLIKRCF
ncbi:DegT/DnrJ/EryC1/StrS family aminotransferase [Glaciecola sp. MH2013]|uniref:DegT/DnrJ/EryC1/StrS family aminotransferase n=1 Tax=Glaciecola sp. MH2013 TaxID=2785524 RepID=UPI00189C8312|nr:DegT/DnrJ/EryC1/StrS family aminotransferase [Glaciecola sp. MH2013]MBF7072228.1 DegT/DnrJ/EryC1/StrS family aminotransferase [Glaciecola sp. MH2013]